MPVSYRVSISGFAQDERTELARCFERRSLIAYQAVADTAQSDIAIVDADMPQTFHDVVGQRESTRILYVGHCMPSEARWYVPRPVEPSLVLRMLDELIANERPAPHAFVDYFSELVVAAPRRPILDDATRRRLAGLGAAAVPAPIAPQPSSDTPFGTALDTSPQPVGLTPFRVGAEVDDDALDSALMPFDLIGDPDVRFADAAGPAAAPATPAAVSLRRGWDGSVDRRAEKRSQRAAVRRAQRTSRIGVSGYAVSAGMVGAGPDAVHALVLDSHSPSRIETGVLLSAFGFHAQTVSSVAEAERALWSKPFAVAFLGEPAEGPQSQVGIDMCHRIKQGAYGTPYLKPKIVMVASKPRPVDSVRARLAGCDHFVQGPTNRGLVAQALDAVGVPMPHDPRGD